MSQINIFKKINRNAFNEKLIHRYLFERYYFGTSLQRKKLLPERLRKSPINLIVPEDSKSEAKYRADLTIYFRNQTCGIPVEVKWFLEGFTKRNQIDYLKQNNGFIVILGDTTETKMEGIDVISINHDDFSSWIAENISRLSRESLIYQAGSKKFSDKTQHWLVFLKGGQKGPAIKHFDNMLKSKPAYPFWAFRQHAKALPNILEMQRGDKLIFIFAKTKNMAQPKDPNEKVLIARYYICDIVEPYYMALDNSRGLFFEKDTVDKDHVEIGDRRWPHFIDFEIGSGKKRYTNGEYLLFGKQGEFVEAFSNSFNHGGGTPYPLSRAQFEKLKDRLFKLAEEIK
ncbi:MAG: hypothetical protein WC297_01205 [Candidatus Paceibacterota bacterium]|jgi:hypothetical protein